jgi:hypothetical protein
MYSVSSWAQQKQARRQRIPAFGEWNYSYGGDWPVTQYSDSAVPPSLAPLPVKKVTESDPSPYSHAFLV